MRCLVLCIVALATLFPALAQAYDVLVLQSRRDPAYEETIKGFRAAGHFSERLVVLSDYAAVDLNRIVREDKPLVVLAVGDAALEAARGLSQTPVIAVMSLGIHRRANGPNMTGVGMYAAPETFLNLFRKMGKRRVGVIYSAGRSGWYLRQARQAAEAAGIELVTREVTHPRETVERLTSLANKVDALWMLPDATAITRETTEAFFHFSQEHQTPVVSFAGAYLGLGASLAVELDRGAIGSQAAALARALLKGASAREHAVEVPGTTRIKANPDVLRKLGIKADLFRDDLSVLSNSSGWISLLTE